MSRICSQVDVAFCDGRHDRDDGAVTDGGTGYLPFQGQHRDGRWHEPWAPIAIVRRSRLARTAVMITGVALGLAAPAGTATADPRDYVFSLVENHVSASPSVPIAVRLIHAPTKKAVTNAVIFQSKLEMPMAGMAPMVAKVTPQANDGAGAYRFVGDLSIAGTWTLTLQAKVQGEPRTVIGSVQLTSEDGGSAHPR